VNVETPTKTRPRLFLIDGYALIYRSFFAMISRPLVTSRGENTSAVFGFTRFLLKILEEHEPDYLGVVLDAGTSDRVQRYPAYKATREKMPDELRASLPRIRQVLEGFRVPVLELADCEADDVIGTLAEQAADRGLEAVIVSGDKDFYQLIQPGISLLNPGRGGPGGVEEEWVDTRNAAERLGVPPERVVDYLALIGDSSDNIPGARGIGPKTAISLIDRFGGVEQILAQAENIPAKRARSALEEHRADVELSRELVTIRTDLPITLDLPALAVGEPDREALRDVFLELEFHSLVRELAPGAAPQAESFKYRMAGADDVATMAAELAAAGRVAVEVEGSSSDPMRAVVVGIGLAPPSGQAFYVPLGHRAAGQLPLDDVGRNLPALASPALAPLVTVLQDPAVRKIGHNLKYSVLVLRRAGVELRGIDFDTMIASYLIDPGRREHNLDSLALQYLKRRTITHEDVCGKGRDRLPIAECEVERVAELACQNADVTWRLAGLFTEQLAQYALDGLFRDIEMPLLEVLADMEQAGIRIDTDFFAAMQQKLERDLRLTQEEIWKEAGVEFNINSTPQLREILFEKLDLPVLKRTKTGASTDATVLEELAAAGHRLPMLLMEYRQLDKLKSTYVDALPLLVNSETGRIHTNFNQTVAATGRLSSSEPNLQNIPIRTDVGAELRKGFVPAAGNQFLSADYSQIELRILAHLSGDPAFVEAFRRDIDIHRQTAAMVFDVPIDAVDGRMRAAAKTINFATIYGIGPFALSKQLGTSVPEAREFIARYFQRFPQVRAYLDEQIRQARERGFVETLSGRRRYIPEVRSRNYNIRQFGERAATNAPVQGSAADVIKVAMIAIHRELAGSGSRMVLQVHDELVFDVPRPAMERTKEVVRRLMEGAFVLSVPLRVSLGVGENWLECK
jgi:DNA polymerase I